MLKVKRTMDPPMIQWENLNVRRRTQVGWLLLTYFLSFVIILLSLVAVYTIESTKREIVFEKLIPPMLIACIVSGTKFIMRKITKLEKHHSESDSRKSMVRKMIILQFCTVGLIVLINSFDQRLTELLGFSASSK